MMLFGDWMSAAARASMSIFFSPEKYDGGQKFWEMYSSN